MTDAQNILHATTVAVDGHAVMIIGPSGAGKSALALQLLALGAELIADDRTIVLRDGAEILTSAPATIAGQIEARGVGILTLPARAAPTPLALVVDMGHPETQRLPQEHHHEVLGLSLPCLHNPEIAHFPSAVLLYMKGIANQPQ